MNKPSRRLSILAVQSEKYAAGARVFLARMRALAVAEEKRPAVLADSLCTEAGWIVHTPTADGVCPVPPGVEFMVRLRNGATLRGARNMSWELGIAGLRKPCRGDIVSWRPIRSETAQAAERQKT